MRFSVIVAATSRTRGIGCNGGLPWKLPGDMKFFRKTTTNAPNERERNAVIMGRKTWDSIPAKFRPLKGRLNVVISRNKDLFAKDPSSRSQVLLANSFQGALDMVQVIKANTQSINDVFVIGGGSVYAEAVKSPDCQNILLTSVYADEIDAKCDVFFPAIDSSTFVTEETSERQKENGIAYEFVRYARRSADASAENCDPNASAAQPAASKPAAAAVPRGLSDAKSDGKRNFEEMQYLNLIRDIMDNGVRKGDRTGTGTMSKFGCQMRFSLRETFPLLTTKRVFWRGVAEELLWFLRGCTNAKTLTDKGVRIWKANGSREYLDRIGLTDREENDLGPVYGFQWRHFGAEYKTMHDDYTGQGVDQLMNVINTIKNKPTDRRIIMSAWNPADLKKMALPPCHMFCQFYVANGELSCQMYQRSCDMGLGVPFNIASYALLTRMIAQVCDLKPGDFIHTLGDAHVYMNHIEPLREQIKREPRAFPTLTIDPNVKDINDFKMEHFKIEGYKPYPKIKMKMAV